MASGRSLPPQSSPVTDEPGRGSRIPDVSRAGPAIARPSTPARAKMSCESSTRHRTAASAWARDRWSLLLLWAVWAAIYLASLASPPLLDDADATHAQAAQAMLRTGDLVTLHVDGIRYLEKAPLPYWLTAGSLRLFSGNSFAVHLPLALTVLALALLGRHWGRRAFDDSAFPDKAFPGGAERKSSLGPEARTVREASSTAGFYSALFALTSAGVFLFTRIFIPDALLSLLLALALYAALRALEPASNSHLWAGALSLALAAAVLTKGLVALVLLLGALALYLPLAGELRLWRRLHPALGSGLLLAVAAPWHILAGLRNRHGAGGHGFFWFYFVNEHILRFLGRRSPPDYNKLPTLAYWSLHLVWLFPWSFFLPVAFFAAWNRRKPGWQPGLPLPSFGARSTLLLTLFSALLLLFFSFSTNQEYYTFPAYLPILLLVAAALTRAERPCTEQADSSSSTARVLLACQWTLTSLCLLAATALAAGLWSSRHLPAAAQVGLLAAHRGVGNYTLSLSHFFDLTDASFSALRLPAALACGGLAAGSILSLALRRRRRHRAATVTLALMSTVLLVAAHLALLRFSSLLSSKNFALQIQQLERTRAVEPGTEVLLYGDQALGSSIPFYLDRQVGLVDGRSTSMLFGSTFPDAPPIFLTAAQLSASWGRGPRKLLFVPLEHRADVDQLLGPRQIVLYESAGKALVTDRPLRPAPPAMDRDLHLANNGAKP